MSASLALLMLAAAPDLGAAAPAFATFDAVCARADTVDVAGERATAEGWSEFEPEKNSPLGYIVGVTRAFGGPEGDRSFRRDDGSINIWVRRTIPAPMGQFVECKVYDFAVAEVPPRAALVAWAGGKPSSVVEISGDIALGWDKADGSMVLVSIQTPPCFVAGKCQASRLVIERSVAVKP